MNRQPPSKKRGKDVLFPVFTIISLLFILCCNVPCLYADYDTSLRTDLNFNYTISERFKSVSYVFIQVNEDASHFNYTEWGTGLQYQTPLKWISFLVFYQQGYSKSDQGSWYLEQRPSVNMNTSTNISLFKISNQIRYEYRINTDWHDYRIKNTLVISCPEVFLRPSVGWELYYEHHDRDITLNRIKFGITKDINAHFSLGPYYRIDFSKNNHHWDFTRQLIGFHVTINY
ncbi:MAG TPA: DUF2490 domain-containing protein [Smithellaceae bacterium]|jgi:hypothetical protein|nr:DUF2490 domain-containing protein [Deltaproteobacteria bacterium]HNV65027.1 DUF2490 domain-containing protein [Smithellaceae bacterium]HOU04086.1 DUF2490 domain-containing protein [Smithellaceae bacterium]HOZ61130.1 DUF2490 domain-containing protein [Smithellaceae bacterium]HPG54241.1 DUF2490 domain-containing protein [Smithellaceae bacterium]